MILNVSHLSKSFGSDAVIKDASFFLDAHEKAAVTGNNGAGKTTLLRMISGETSSDSGTAVFARDITFGYLHQNIDIDSHLTIREELTKVIRPVLDAEEKMTSLQAQMKTADGETLKKLYGEYDRTLFFYEQADGYSARSRINGILNGLGFSDAESEKYMEELSGGQKTRVFLGKLLLENPDLIFLDEPTNHLDLRSIEWLEGYLLSYRGAALIVSHDRYFLDRIVTKVIDIDQGIAVSYEGSYTQFAERKAAERDAAMKAYLNQQQEIRRQEEVITKLKSFNREKSIKRAESREKMLDRIERLDKPTEEKSDMALFFAQSQASGSDVLNVEHIAKSFDEENLFSDLSFELKRGEHVALIGDNGTGKTTILKIINGLLEPDSGTVTLGARVLIAYYDQEHQVLHKEKTLFEELQDTWPDLNNTAVRNMLAAFLFTGDDAFKKVGDLSGGERGRISLAKLMLSEANFLILDEPTNHLDAISREILENAIRKFDGTVLFVSHDRYFINRSANRILDLSGRRLVNYIGNYDYYLSKRETVILPDLPDAGDKTVPSPADGQPCTNSVKTGEKSAWENQKMQQAQKRKLKNEREKCEALISRLEEDLKNLEKEFADPLNQRNAAKLEALQKQKDADETELSELYDKWSFLAGREEDES